MKTSLQSLEVLLFRASTAALIATSLMACGINGKNNPATASKPVVATEKGATIGYDEVKPIFEKRCASCHNASTGDLNWLNAEKATAAARRGAMVARLTAKTMPPVGSTEASSLTESERETLISWANRRSDTAPGADTPGIPAGAADTADVIRNRKLAFLNRCAS